VFTMTPASGPTSGGTVVRITREAGFGTWAYGVEFGGVPAVRTTRIDEHTLEAVTPPHFPGTSSIRIFEYDLFLGTDLTFTFEGPVPVEAYERLLLPIFVPPVRGAFGSEFHTELRLSRNGFEPVLQAFGLETKCPHCPRFPLTDYPILLGELKPEVEPHLNFTGRPGRLIYMPKEHVEYLTGNLRVFDVSRAALNFGTEIPIVPEHEFKDLEVVLLGVPTDPRFRNTLRIYSYAPMQVEVVLQGHSPVTVTLRPGDDVFDPAYGVFTAFPTHGAPVRVVVRRIQPGGVATPIDPDLKIWAFVSVTNNETQLITTITPQP
jgi:hypothetical protein